MISSYEPRFPQEAQNLLKDFRERNSRNHPTPNDVLGLVDVLNAP
jgi:hypothetical protein